MAETPNPTSPKPSTPSGPGGATTSGAPGAPGTPGKPGMTPPGLDTSKGAPRSSTSADALSGDVPPDDPGDGGERDKNTIINVRD